MKKGRFPKAIALLLTIALLLSLAINNVDVARAASNTVTFKNGSTVVGTKNVNTGDTVESLNVPETDGKLFAGWFTRNVGDITNVSNALNFAYDFSSEVNSSKTLYAGWINVGTGESSEFYLMGTQYREKSSDTTAGLRFMTRINDSLVENIQALNLANSGIRPTNSNQKGIGYGTVVTYAESLKDGSMLIKEPSALVISDDFYVVPAVKTYTFGSDHRIYTALVVGIPEEGYSQHIAARPYITYADANGVTQTYYYTETSDTTHKLGGAYYLNYNEAVDDRVCDDIIDVEQPSTEAPTTGSNPQGYDLVVTNISWDLNQAVIGGKVVFTATIKNNGDTDIPAGKVIEYQAQVDGNTSAIWWSDTYNSGLRAGESVDLTCNLGTNGVNYWTAIKGSHSVTVWVDDVNRFTEETNEDNNKYTAIINVSEVQTTTQSSTVENNKTGITIYFYGKNWTSAYLWSWNGYSTTSWPGDAFSRVSGTNNWWKLTVSASKLSGYVQETGGGRGCDKNFGTISGYGTYFVVYNNNTEKLYTSQSSAEALAGEKLSGEVTEKPTEAPTMGNNTSGITIYFYGYDWSSAYLWARGYSQPGKALTKVNGTSGWWTITVDASSIPAGYIQEVASGTGYNRSYGSISGYGTYYIVYINDTETLYTSQSEAEKIAGETLGGAPCVDKANASPSTGATANGRVVGYNVPSGKTKSSNVSMTANGAAVGVFDTIVNNTHVFKNYPSLSTARVAIFDFTGTAEVTLAVNYNVSSAVVRPVGDGITPVITHSGNTSYITFPITEYGQYSVELNGNLTDTILIFAGEIENRPTGNVRVISGVHNGDITVGQGETLYIEGGAAVYGRIICKSNSVVCGRGIIDGSKYDTWVSKNGEAKIPVAIEYCSNVHVSGVSVLNPNCWNYQILDSNQVYLDNIKIISARPNGDGISIQSSSYVYINDSFLRTWDDGIVLKNYSSNNTHDVYCDNIVLWTDLAQTMEIGVETNAGYNGKPANPAIYNVEFTNIDIIHALHKAPISIHNGDNANIYNIKWENVTIDDCSTGQGDGWNIWLDLTTCHASDFGGASSWSHNWDGTGTIHDVIFKNIQVTSSTNAGHRVIDYTGSSIYNITCENVYVNGSLFRY